jgi:hypothetical protein
MRRVVMSVVLVVTAAAAVLALVNGTWTMVLAAVVGGAGLWQFGRCRHPGPLGLLPPSTDDAGQPVPARWFCDACGQSWPAAFDHGQPPVRRFDGYDPSKAVTAAKRADDLARRQRALAVRRAGLETPRQPTRQPRIQPESAEVVAIRRFAK